MARERDWLLIAVFVLVGACLYVWLVGSAAGVLFGAGWPHVPASSLPWALGSWLAHPGDPRSGFPAAVRARLPGVTAMYAALLIVAASIACAIRLARRPHGVGALRVLDALRDELCKGARSSQGSARFGGAGDLRDLSVSSSQPGRLTIGRVGSHLVAGERGHSLLVVGPTQSGKTTGLAIPALLEWRGPALVTSVKRDLHEHTSAARERQARVWVYDPSSATGLETCRWNLLEHCGTWRGAVRMAHWLMSAAESAPGERSEARFWSLLAEKLLAPLLLAAGGDGLTMVELMRWVNLQESGEVEMRLKGSGRELAREAWQASVSRDPRTLSSVYASVETVLSAYEDPEVLDSTIGEGLSGARLLDSGAGTAYICAPAHEQERLAPLFAALVREVVAAAYDRYSQTGRPIDPPLLVLLDEAGNIAPLPDLAKLAATGAGVGVQIVSVWHDLSQLRAVYDRGAETVLNNHRAKLVLSGIGDERTLRWVQGTLGDQRVEQLSRTHSERRASRTESSTFRPLAPAPLTRQQHAGEGLLIYGNRPPVRLMLRPFYGDRRLCALAEGRPPGDRPGGRVRWPIGRAPRGA